MAAITAAAVLAVLLGLPRTSDVAGGAGPDTDTTVASSMDLALASTTDAAGDDAVFDLMVNMAAGLSPEAIQEITPSAFGTTGMVQAMTPAEREAFVRLVKKEFGGTE
jgi:hypothetical protein